MANIYRSANDNQVTTVTTGLGENSNAATDSGDADTKPAAKQSRYGEASNSGHNTPNPALGNQLPSGPASQSHHQGHNQQSQHGSYPYNNPYYMNYMSQYRGYGGQQQGYGSFGRSMYGQPHHYGMSPQTSYGQHASPANVGGFGGASANERGTNNGGHSANTHSANTSNGGHSTNNGGYFSGPQGFQMYRGQIPPGSVNNWGYSANNGGYLPTMHMQPGMQRPPMESMTSMRGPSTNSTIYEGHSRDDLALLLAARHLHNIRARVDESESGMQDETSTVSSDETGILTPTKTEAGDSEADAHN